MLARLGFVPAGVFRDPVVGNHQRPALGFRKMRKHDHRHLGQPELLGLAKNPPVTGDDHVAGANQHRVRRKPNSAIEPAIFAI